MSEGLYVHGDQAPNGLYFCAVCESFEEESHFEKHKGINRYLLEEAHRFFRARDVKILKRAAVVGGLRFHDEEPEE